MKINEIEEALQISRANIRFYEKEGLLSPARKANGYRDYDEEDYARLQKIIIFRKLGMSIPDIRDVLDGKLPVSDAIKRSIESLNEQIQELSGALEVCKIIEKDTTADTAFNQGKYWELIQTEEKKGLHFTDFMRDYLIFEQNAMISMWKSAFLFWNIEDIVKKKGWIFTGAILFLICVIRGVSAQVTGNGGFWYGFAYPFVVFLIISLIVLPLFFIQYKYKDVELTEEPEEPAKMKSPLWVALWGLVKLAGVLAYVFLIILGIPFFTETLLTDYKFGEETTFLMTGNSFLLCVIFGLYLLFLFVWLYSKEGLFGGASEEGGFKAHLPKKVKAKVMTWAVGLLLMGILMFVSWYDCFSESGVTKQRLIFTKTYTWDDVDYYTLTACSDGTLKYSVVMKDGYRPVIMGSSVAIYNFPPETYPDEDLDFGRYLVSVFSKKGIELKVKDAEKLMKDLDYDYWREYAEEILSLAGNSSSSQ